MKNMKKTHFLIVIVLAIFTMSSCLKDDAQPTPQAIVTLLNSYPDASDVYYQMDGRIINNVSFPYKTYTSFRAFPGSKRLEVMSRLENKMLIDTTMNYADSTFYTGFVYGAVGKPKFIRTTDSPVENLGEKAAARFVQLGNGVAKVTFQIGDQEVAAFKDRVQENKNTVSEAQIFRPINTGTFKVTAKDEQGNIVAEREDIVFKKGLYYTFALMGTKGDSEKPLYIGYLSAE